MHFLGAEPQARQLEQVRLRRVLVQAITTRLPVPDDRHAHPVAQVFQVALESRARDFELIEKLVAPDHPALFQQAVNLVEALGTIHRRLSSFRGRG